MLISFLPAGDVDTASSRIRVYSIAEALKEGGVEVASTYDPSAQIFVFQKKLTAEILQLAKKLVSEGKIVIYDFDDLGPGLDYWAEDSLFRDMLKTAQLVTTDTAGHRDYLLEHYDVVTPVELIPDTIDYFPQFYQQPEELYYNELRVLWFGSVSNIVLFEKYVHILHKIPNVKIVVATNPQSIPELHAKYPFVEFKPWTLDGFPSILKDCHLAFLMHDGSEIDRAKSNNKMICSINLGVPVLVSDTPEYAATAKLAGVDYSVFSNEEDINRAIEILRTHEARLKYLHVAQPRIWENFSPMEVGRKFMMLLGDFVGGRLKIPETKKKAPLFENKISQPTVAVPTPIIAEKKELERDYLRDWVNPEGTAYRIGVYERQKKDGNKPLMANPTYDEFEKEISKYNPSKVLEVGCGWGRIMDELKHKFDIYGCDVSQDLLERCSKDLKVFYYDAAKDGFNLPENHRKAFDVLFCRGLMLYFMETPLQMVYVMNNMMMLAKKKIIVWEWPEVCAKMQAACTSPLFEYHPIEHRSE